MTGHYPRIRQSTSSPLGDRLSQREVVRLVLHLPFDHADLSLGMNRALDVYLRAVGTGPDILSDWCDVEGELDEFPLDESGWAFIRSTLSLPTRARYLDDETDARYVLRREKKQFDRCVELSGGAQGLSGYGFFYLSRLPLREPSPGKVSLVSFSWPTEYLEVQGPSRMRELSLELASLLPYSSGHAGLAFYSPNVYGHSMEGIRDEAFRYPGLDITHGQLDLGARVDGVHWLNFLGPPVLAEVGGVSGLRARLQSPGTTVQALSDARAVITLGPWPESGDVAQGQVLPAYRELARVLEPWLYPCPSHRSWMDCAPGDAQRWWRRFLD